MIEGQTAYNSNGVQVSLYPLQYIGITAGPNASNHVVSGVSNSGLYDNGWHGSRQTPLFAPFDMELMQNRSDGAHTQMWRSLTAVVVPGFSSPQYVTFSVSHSQTLYYSTIGETVGQGTHFYDTGDYGLSSGPHVHFCLYVGSRSSMFPTGYNSYVGGNIYYSPNPPSTIADLFYKGINDTISASGGYTWTEWTGDSPTPPTPTNVKKMPLWMMTRKWRRLV